MSDAGSLFTTRLREAELTRWTFALGAAVLFWALPAVPMRGAVVDTPTSTDTHSGPNDPARPVNGSSIASIQGDLCDHPDGFPPAGGDCLATTVLRGYIEEISTGFRFEFILTGPAFVGRSDPHAVSADPTLPISAAGYDTCIGSPAPGPPGDVTGTDIPCSPECPADGSCKVYTEILHLSATDEFNTITLVAGQFVDPTLPRSLGEVISVPSGGIGFPGMSYFCMFFEVQVPGTGLVLRNLEPMLIQRKAIESFPPDPSTPYAHTLQTIDLYEPGAMTPTYRLVEAGHFVGIVVPAQDLKVPFSKDGFGTITNAGSQHTACGAVQMTEVSGAALSIDLGAGMCDLTPSMTGLELVSTWESQFVYTSQAASGGPPWEVRGMHQGPFTLKSGGQVVAVGGMYGTNGTGTHRVPLNDPTHTCETCDEPCTHFEGALQGVIVSGPRLGCELIATYAGDFDDEGCTSCKSPLGDPPEGGVRMTLEGVLVCPCND